MAVKGRKWLAFRGLGTGGARFSGVFGVGGGQGPLAGRFLRPNEARQDLTSAGIATGLKPHTSFWPPGEYGIRTRSTFGDGGQ